VAFIESILPHAGRNTFTGGKSRQRQRTDGACGRCDPCIAVGERGGQAQAKRRICGKSTADAEPARRGRQRRRLRLDHDRRSALVPACAVVFVSRDVDLMHACVECRDDAPATVAPARHLGHRGKRRNADEWQAGAERQSLRDAAGNA
jgi:hypothetical protein